MAVLTVGNISLGIGLDMTPADVELPTKEIILATSTNYSVGYLNGRIRQAYTGTGFTFDGAQKLTGGIVTQYSEFFDSTVYVNVTGLSASAAAFSDADNEKIFRAIFAGADSFSGSTLYDDKLNAFDGNDIISGGGGNDTIDGGGGNDQIDGGTGTDVALYHGSARNYAWTRNANGSWTVSDHTTGRADGVDSLTNIETLQFADRTVFLTSTAPAQTLDIAYDHILRFSPVGAESAFVGDLAARVSAGNLSQAAAVSQLVTRAAATTSVATLAYQFFTGSTPSGEGLDYLVSPTGGNANNLNSAYYQSFNLENRYINFAVNLGKLGAGRGGFEAGYGAKTLIDTVKQAYQIIFGSVATDAKAHALVDPRADYFAYYGGDGPNGIGTKAAAVGWLLAEAVKANVGTMQTANMAYLVDLADGAPFAVNLVGSYPNTPYMG